MDIAQFLNAVDAAVWGPPMIALLISCHLYTTVRTGFIQRKLPLALRLSITKDPNSPGDVSQFAAMITALASTLGTGSIIGVATAIISGGPGAVFWMWITGILGMATKYTEVFASVKYRVKNAKGQMMGGAMYIWEERFRRPDGSVPWFAKAMAMTFAILAGLAILGIGGAVQTSAMTGVVCDNFPVDPLVVSTVIAGSGLVVMYGGVKSISSICEKLVPFMAVAYVGGCLYILAVNGAYLIPAVMTILESAFTAKAAFGGALGSGLMMALQYGCARGLFSNESGLGSAPIIAAAASTRNPARQALAAMTGTFWCTAVVCLLTGLVMVSSLLANPQILEGDVVLQGTQLASAVFGSIPYVGTPILVVGILCFAYSTFLGWSYYGERCAQYLFGERGIKPYLIAYALVGWFGGIGVGSVVWTISDICNALMALPNLVIVFILTGMVARETKHYVYDGNIDQECTDPIPLYGQPRVLAKDKGKAGK